MQTLPSHFQAQTTVGLGQALTIVPEQAIYFRIDNDCLFHILANDPARLLSLMCLLPRWQTISWKDISHLLSLMIHLPEKMMTRKKVTELMMKAVILLMLLVISSHSKKLIEWPIIAGTSCANYKRWHTCVQPLNPWKPFSKASDLSSLTILSWDSQFSVQSHGLMTRQANLTINGGTSWKDAISCIINFISGLLRWVLHQILWILCKSIVKL